ncbi:regulator of G protein signaling domain-containing protein [Ditylenchus destructor]|uniref:Regulator of G protein signaling domain-containing protein n=1 Tax=Ditylenchus destructor TaxID=166010 RepID=A0AAD4N1P4_9BILA|nr:regulator of G protein signaling domain-containing protein [Ditylenchus destructor]
MYLNFVSVTVFSGGPFYPVLNFRVSYGFLSQTEPEFASHRRWRASPVVGRGPPDLPPWNVGGGIPGEVEWCEPGPSGLNSSSPIQEQPTSQQEAAPSPLNRAAELNRSLSHPISASAHHNSSKLTPKNSLGQMLLKLLPCNCSSMGNNQGLGIHSTDGLAGNVAGLDLMDDKTTFEEVAAWGMSFDRLMKHKIGQKYFAEFLKSEYSDENILFWQACEELKRERNTEKIEEKARIIYEDFISILSPKEVSLDSRVREIINNNMVRPSAHTFDEAQNQIYTLMQRDSYPRFIASHLYKKILSSYGHMEEL